MLISGLLLSACKAPENDRDFSLFPAISPALTYASACAFTNKAEGCSWARCLHCGATAATICILGARLSGLRIHQQKSVPGLIPVMNVVACVCTNASRSSRPASRCSLDALGIVSIHADAYLLVPVFPGCHLAAGLASRRSQVPSRETPSQFA